MAVERIARFVEGDVIGQLHRQVFHRHRHDAALLAMDDRDRAAPIALPRDAPVAQAEIDLALRHRREINRKFAAELLAGALRRNLPEPDPAARGC